LGLCDLLAKQPQPQVGRHRKQDEPRLLYARKYARCFGRMSALMNFVYNRSHGKG
jgi:hypothetical protein